MILIARLFSWIGGSWASTSQARVLYAALTLGFTTMAVAGAVKGDALVIALGLVFAIATASIAMLAPRLAPLVAPPRRETDA